MSVKPNTTLIETDKLKLLIMDAPKETNLHLYIKEMKRYDVKHIVRISEPSYNIEEVENAGIKVHEMFFVDGASPPEEIIRNWLSLIADTFVLSRNATKPCIAVHCVAGLGRAPVLVAIALIEYGMDPISAVTFIRERRRGSINQVQLAYLENYTPSKRSTRCCIM